MKLHNKNVKNLKVETLNSSDDSIYKKLKKIQVFDNISYNEKIIDEVFLGNTGVVKRNLTLGKEDIRVLIVYLDGMINKALVSENVISPIINSEKISIKMNDINANFINEKLISPMDVKEASTFDTVVYEMFNGNTIMFIENCKSSFIIDSSEINGRNVDKPDTEQTIRGSKQAFVEDINVNIVLLRKTIKTPDLRVELLNVGKLTKTSIAIVYLKNVINEDLPQQIKNKINSIDIDGIFDSNQIQSLIQKHKWTVFPQMLATERVDRITSCILEGRAAIIVNGSPFALVVPTTFNLFLSTPDDYYGRSLISSLLRIIRYIGLIEACSVSSLYIALTTYNPGLLPTALTLSITGTRLGLPFPTILEVVIMELALYLVQEASIRLPKVVGSTVGIVGALVIGQSVVQAGLVSPIIVVIVSLSAISSFTLPNYTIALSTIGIRLFLIACSSLLGLFGFVLGALGILVHVSSLESFGVKYLSDFSPYSIDNIKDTLLVAPLHLIKKRPKYLKTKNIEKAKSNKKDDTND